MGPAARKSSSPGGRDAGPDDRRYDRPLSPRVCVWTPGKGAAYANQEFENRVSLISNWAGSQQTVEGPGAAFGWEERGMQSLGAINQARSPWPTLCGSWNRIAAMRQVPELVRKSGRRTDGMPNAVAATLDGRQKSAGGGRSNEKNAVKSLR